MQIRSMCLPSPYSNISRNLRVVFLNTAPMQIVQRSNSHSEYACDGDLRPHTELIHTAALSIVRCLGAQARNIQTDAAVV